MGLGIFLMSLTSCMSRSIYVSTEGSDDNDGTEQHPLATLQKAQELARHTCPLLDAQVIVEDGIYYLPEMLTLTHEDNGCTFRARHPQQAILSGGMQLHLAWKISQQPGVYEAQVETGDTIDQLYVGGRRKPMARYPNRTNAPGCNVYDVWNLGDGEMGNPELDALYPSRIATWKNPQGGYIHAMHNYLWGDMHWRITGNALDENGIPDSTRLAYEGGWQNNRPAPMHPKFRFVENLREELDAPGEWYHDLTNHTLYYMPEEGEDITQATVEAVRLKCLIALKGSEEKPVRKIHIEGFTFRHAARTFMDNREPLLRSDWTVYRGGAILYQGAEDCQLCDCDFDQLGGNTIFADGYNRGLIFRGCYIHDSGANGIAFVGDTASVRHPLFTYGGYTPFDLTDTIPGPRSNAYPRECLVEECIITHTGRDEKQTAPIQISMAYGIHVNHCSIYNVPRAGINISEGTFGGHVIENCDIFETVLETGDHGSFNSWGRDRFWGNDMARYHIEHPEAYRMDMLDRNILHHNRWRCDHGWDIDLDDGSSYYLIYDNLLLHGGLKMREGFHRTAFNNLIINNSLHPHVWMPQSGDVVTHNVVMSAYRPAAMTSELSDSDPWGERVDSNYFACPDTERMQFLRNGCDSASVSGVLQFANPAEGDYTITNTEETDRIGFHNFRMDDFGVTLPRLRAIVRHPEFPVPNVRHVAQTEEAVTYPWEGATLTYLHGEQLSAFGMDLSAQALAVSCPKDCKVLQTGVRHGDLIIRVNGKDVDSPQFFQPFAEGKEAIRSIIVKRNQQELEISMGE